MKKFFKFIFVFVLSFFCFIDITNAESDYYKSSWSYEWNSPGDVSSIVDMVKTSTGYAGVGYYSDGGRNYTGVILEFDNNGGFVKKTELNSFKFLRIINTDDCYYVFGINGLKDQYVIYQYDANFSLINTLICDSKEDISSKDNLYFHVIESDDNLFL